MEGSDPPTTGQGDAPGTKVATAPVNNTQSQSQPNKRNRNQKPKGGNNNNNNPHRDPASGAFIGGGLNPARAPVHVPRNAIECVICAEPCRALCVFGCGHATCYSCGLRIHTIQGGACPICRTECAETIITQTVSANPEKYSEEEMKDMRQLGVVDRKLKCIIDGQPLARQVCKLYEYLCPADTCWRRGEQDPFYELAMLKAHLHTDHKLHYCDICVDSRPVFLCEQAIYDSEALQQHLEGKCEHDSLSFTGHPQCKFCKDAHTKLFSRFYDGEALLKHMQQNHFTCDLCNRGQFTYTFFQNRAKLDQHFMQNHQVCDHPDCSHMDLMLRVFANEFELAGHKQRVHGIKAKVVLSLDTSMGTTSGANTYNNSNNRGGAPANANANALEITFDHIYRREIVNLMPSRNVGGAAGKHRGKKGAHQTVANVPGEAGLPLQYYALNAMPILVQANAASTSKNRNHGNNNNNDGTDGDDESGSPHTRSAQFGGRGGAGGKAAPADTRSLKEREQALQAIIDRELRSPVALANFKRHTSEFLQSRLMTSEYYNVLATECFPDPAVFAEVMPLLIATAPVESKRVSLGEYWHVRQAPETQRMLRMKHEEDAKQREIEEQQRIWDELKRGQARPKMHANKNNGKVNAWQTRSGGAGGATQDAPAWQATATTTTAPRGGSGGARKGGRGVTLNAWSAGPSAAVLATRRDDSSTPSLSASSPAPQAVASPNARSAGGGGGAWGGTDTTVSNTSPAAPDRTSAEMYPSLPTQPSRLNSIGLIGKGGKHKKSKPNAWFSN